MIAIETRGDLLLERCPGKQIACKLFNRELVESHVGVVRINHPITPPPHVTGAIILIAVGVRVTCCIQPCERHVFAVPL